MNEDAYTKAVQRTLPEQTVTGYAIKEG